MRRLRELREKRGLTLKQVAAELHLRNQYISNYELGKRNPDFETLKQFADFYHVTTDYLLEREDEENPRSVTDDEIKFALFGTKDIDDNVLDKVRQFAKFTQEYNDK